MPSIGVGLNTLAQMDSMAQQAGAIRFGSLNFNAAQSALTAQLSQIAAYFMLTSQTSQCETDLASVGVTNEQMSAAASAANIINGLTSTANYAQAIYGNSAAFGAAVATYGNQTVEYFMMAHPATAAVSQAPGNNIYINSGWVSGMNFGQQMGMLLHELLHNITGQSDDVLQGDLGLSTNAPSQNIGDKLEKDCVP
jgi:hypothetical protein